MTPKLPAPQIQLIRRAYSSVGDVVNHFDIAACCIAFDGRDVYATKDARDCLTHGVIPCSSSHRSYAYEMRLLKYAARGFGLSIPELDWKRVPSSLMSDGKKSFVCLENDCALVLPSIGT